MRGNSFWSDAYRDDAFCVTSAGHFGPIYVENNDLRADTWSANDTEGGIVAWTPSGTWLDARGFSTRGLYVRGNVIHGTGLHANVAASGCGTVWTDPNTFQLGGHGVEFDNASGGSVLNGNKYLPSASMAGWHKAVARPVTGSMAPTCV